MNISHLTPTFSDIKTWVRAAAVSVNQLITGKQDKSDNLTSLSGLDLTGHSGDAVVVTAGEDGFELVAGAAGGTTTNALTMDNSGAGAASGTTFDGSAARTISYNTVGAAASGHNHSGVYQPADATLTALAAYNTNGLIAQTAADTFAGRTLTGPAAGITVTNGNGVAGNPTLALADDLAALEALSGTNTIYYRSAANTWTAVTFGSFLSFAGGLLSRNKGTSFPGSPASGDFYYRTDRNIEYFYDGTRWLSTQLFTLPIGEQDALNPVTATTGFKHRTVNPWAGLYDIYVEEGVFGYFLTAAGNWTLSIVDQNAVTLITTTVSTASTHTTVRVTENTAYANATYKNFNLSVTENSGTASLYVYAALTYRLIG